MPIRLIQTNFTSGMLDSKVRDHIDLAAYRNGVAEMVNCRLLPQGGATRRPGGKVLAKQAHDDYQIEPFVFSDDQAYVFLFYNGNVDIWSKASRTYLTSLAGPWTSAQIAANSIKCEQQLDKMFVCCEDFETRVITRTGASTFTISTFAYSKDNTGVIVYQPYQKYAANTVYITASAVGPGAGVIITSSANHFSASHVGLKLRYRKKQMTVTAYTSPTQVTVTVDEALPSTAAEYDWDEQAFSSIRGYARCMCLHLQRLWIGGGRDAPNAIWGSTLDDAFSFNLGTAQDDEAIKYSIYARKVAKIVSMVSNIHLQIFTTQGEFFVPKPNTNALTPSTFSIEPQSRFGCSNIQAREFDGSTIFVSRKAEGLREFAFDAPSSSYSADALTFMSKSLLTGPRDLDVQMEGTDEEQESRAYIANDDGTVAVLTKVKKENISGWSYWTTTGSFVRLGVVEAELWAITSRTVNGVVGTYLEVFDHDQMMDFSASSTGASSTSWGPFNLHKGQEVSMRSGDLYLGTATVDATTGMVTTPTAVTSIEIGYNFVPTIVPLDQHVQQPDGITMGEPKRYVREIARLVDTISCQIKNRHLGSIQPDEDPGLAPDRYTGDFQVWLLGWEKRQRVEITSPYPLPFTINALVTEVEV